MTAARTSVRRTEPGLQVRDRRRAAHAARRFRVHPDVAELVGAAMEKLGEVAVENGSVVSVIRFVTVGFVGATFEMRAVSGTSVVQGSNLVERRLNAST